MSILGPGSLPVIGLAGSVAASQQRAPNQVDRDKVDQRCRNCRPTKFDLPTAIWTTASRPISRTGKSRIGTPTAAFRGNILMKKKGAIVRLTRMTRSGRARDPQDDRGQMLDVDV